MTKATDLKFCARSASHGFSAVAELLVSRALSYDGPGMTSVWGQLSCASPRSYVSVCSRLTKVDLVLNEVLIM